MDKRSPALLLLLPTLVLAAIVTAADIVAAIQASPTANTWLKQNAQAVANLAINVESAGNTTAYNGSCCYGVLQMNRTNIEKYAKVTPEEYRNQSLQQQINAWSALTTDALRAGIVNRLIGLGTFDGRAVDGHLVLSCVQLGIGNCQTMVNSGSCSGFADRNGTTICSMADRIAGANGNSGGTTSPGSSTGGESGGGAATPPKLDACIRDSSGACLAVTEALQQGFLQGSGQSMSKVKQHIVLIGISGTALIVGTALLGLFRRYSTGRLTQEQFFQHLVQAVTLLAVIVTALML